MTLLNILRNLSFLNQGTCGYWMVTKVNGGGEKNFPETYSMSCNSRPISKGCTDGWDYNTLLCKEKLYPHMHKMSRENPPETVLRRNLQSSPPVNCLALSSRRTEQKRFRHSNIAKLWNKEKEKRFKMDQIIQ